METIVTFDDDFYNLETWLPDKAIDEFVYFVLLRDESLKINQKDF